MHTDHSRFRTRFHIQELESRDVPAGLYVAVGDVLASNPGPELIVGAGDGGGPRIQILRASDRTELFSFFAYEDSFRGGVQVAIGDLDGDGIDEIIAGTGVGGGPAVRVFDGFGNLRESFFAYEDTFRGGVQVAVGDFNGDGTKEILTGTGVGGGPAVKIFGPNAQLREAFFAYEDSFRGGVFVAAGDLNGDGVSEIITGTGVGGGPAVRTFTANRQLLSSFFAYEEDFRGGVYASAGDVNGTGSAQIITSPGPGLAPVVRQFDGLTGQPLAQYTPYDVNDRGGVRVTVGSLDSSGRNDIVAVRVGGPFEQTPVIIPGSLLEPINLPPGSNTPPPTPGGGSSNPMNPGTGEPVPITGAAQVFSDENWAYYVPAGLTQGQRYPILFAFDPGRNPNAYDGVLRPVADQFKWIIATSKYYSNVSAQNPRPDLDLNMNFDETGIFHLGSGYGNIKTQMEDAIGKLPADTSRVILMGVSGGGSVAHAMSLAYPGIASALIVNVGMIWGDTIPGPNPGEGGPQNGPFWNRYIVDFANPLRTEFENANSRQLAAFLESPTDFRFEEMQADQQKLRNVGWTVNPIRFAGGHTTAPLDVYRNAAAWIVNHPDWA